jgi:hypothetical protein
MPATTWKCPNCGTVNKRHIGSCMACGAAEEATAAMRMTEPDKPTLKIEVAPAPSKIETPSTGSSYPDMSKVRGTLPGDSMSHPAAGWTETGSPAEWPPRSSRTAEPAVGSVPETAAVPFVPPPPAPSSTGSAGSRSPGSTTRPATPRGRGSVRRGRRFAVGKLLGIAHIALLVCAAQVFLTGPQWGNRVLIWAYHISVSVGAPVTGATMTAWQANGLIRDGNAWAGDLPWGLTVNIYIALAIACLIMRLTRPMPTWLSLAVALPAAIYGVVGCIAELPFLAEFWPLTSITFVTSWIFVGKTIRRY